MWIRKRTRRHHSLTGEERVYETYSVVESYRGNDGVPRHRQVASLGRHPTVESKLAELGDRLGATRPGPAWDELRAEVIRLEEIAAKLAAGAPTPSAPSATPSTPSTGEEPHMTTTTHDPPEAS